MRLLAGAGGGVADANIGNLCEGESNFVGNSGKGLRTGEVCRGIETGVGEGGVALGCQRFKTVLLRPLLGFGVAGGGLGVLGPSSWALALTML